MARSTTMYVSRFYIFYYYLNCYLNCKTELTIIFFWFSANQDWAAELSEQQNLRIVNLQLEREALKRRNLELIAKNNVCLVHLSSIDKLIDFDYLF